jgi:hypothetical protein
MAITITGTPSALLPGVRTIDHRQVQVWSSTEALVGQTQVMTGTGVYRAVARCSAFHRQSARPCWSAVFRCSPEQEDARDPASEAKSELLYHLAYCPARDWHLFDPELWPSPSGSRLIGV